MAEDYEEFIELGHELIHEFGKDITLTRKSRTGGTDRSPTYSTQPFTLKAVDLEKMQRDKTGTLTGRVSRRLLIEGRPTVVPMKADIVAIDGVQHEIDVIKTITPGTPVVLYIVHLKG